MRQEAQELKVRAGEGTQRLKKFKAMLGYVVKWRSVWATQDYLKRTK